MNQRTILYGLLGIVATAAAVLSFAALRDLAVTCGFSERLAWLLPVVIDAGAAAGSLAWLGSAAPTARTYGRALALVLLASSVGGNALGHGLAAYELAPAWWVVVGVSAIAPAVLGALVHLVVLVGRSAATRLADEESTVQPQQDSLDALDEELDGPIETLEEKAIRLIGEGYGRPRLALALGITEREARALLAEHKGVQEGVQA